MSEKVEEGNARKDGVELTEGVEDGKDNSIVIEEGLVVEDNKGEAPK